ncbi:hypothetical protein HAX54_005669 [Datura stramonium]|uniref:Fatty acyl-CoA reductase n=1 Tax=Datura stramonium TaxID=4076 RepID=A0ABS8T969_DATST|nr:hypothetical protein [Datura stramonium]
MVEKILRIEPNVKRLFLLLRASDNKSARKRFNDEILQAELFNVLREKIGANNLNSLVEEKVFPVGGDVTFEDFGIENLEMKDEMFKEIDIIIHSAATTRFDERYDIAMNVNVLGAFNVLKFAKRCANVKILVHVSTDIDVERKVIDEKLKQLEAQSLTTKEVTMAMRDLGIQRANLHGWPNTYSFTKAMGEMLLGHYKENLQLIIIRPTIITSTFKEPFPGWTEGVKTLDTFILVYGKGLSNIFLADPNSNADLIPGDMVVNSILGAIILQLANLFSWYYLIDGTYTNLERKIDKSIHLSELYKPYLIFNGRFDDSNTERLRMTMKESKMDDVLKFDPSCINWEDYFMNTHIPGVVKRLA